MAQAVKPQEPKAQSFTLLSGHTIPAVGLGTWKSGSQATDSVFSAIVEVIYWLLVPDPIASFFMFACLWLYGYPRTLWDSLLRVDLEDIY